LLRGPDIAAVHSGHSEVTRSPDGMWRDLPLCRDPANRRAEAPLVDHMIDRLELVLGEIRVP